MIIADFIFAITLTAGMSILLFSLAYSLAIVEVTQYVSFSVARAYMAGNKDPNEQESKAQAKFRALSTSKGAIGSLYRTSWFKIGNVEKLDLRGGPTGNGKTFSDDLAGGTDARGLFLGASIPLTFGILKIKIPLIGETMPDEDEGPKTSISTMLIRESTQKECDDFMEQRRSALRNLPSGKKYYENTAYVRMEDNGC